MNSKSQCPRCGQDGLRHWKDLTEEQREVVRRLPGAVDYRPNEREARHKWCTRCWFESTSSDEELA